MKEIQRVGPYIEIVEARSPENSSNVVKVGVSQSAFERYIVGLGQSVKCAQFYGIIRPGLISAVHAFRGLNRPFMSADDMQGDKTIIAYSWKPEFDYVWANSRFNGNPIPRRPPPHLVFVVLMQELKDCQEFPSHGLITGTIEHWSWIEGDPNLDQAPIEWNERYAQRL